MTTDPDIFHLKIRVLDVQLDTNANS